MKQMRDNEYQVDYDGEDNKNDDGSNNNDGEYNNIDDVNGNKKDDLINRVLLKMKTFIDQVIETLNLYSKRDVFRTLIVLVYSAQFGCVFFPHIL